MQVIRELGMEATRPKIISKIMLQNWSLGDIRVASRRHPSIHNLTRYYPWVMSLEPFSVALVEPGDGLDLTSMGSVLSESVHCQFHVQSASYL